jgi:flagellar biosynthesis protein FlhG
MSRISRKAGRVVSIGGGKGGVGKSVVAANLAVAFGHVGARVVVLDGDLGAPNQHTLFGINRPRPGLQAFLDREIDNLDDGAMETEARNVRLIAGSSQVGVANINHGQKTRLLNHIRSIDADVVIIDVGAGTSYNVVDLFDAADLRVVVMTPELTSLQNAYAFLKASAHRAVRTVAVDDDERARLATAMSGAGETGALSRLVDGLAQEKAGLAERVRGVLRHFAAGIVGNWVGSDADVQTFYAMSRMIRDYLSMPANLLATIRQASAIRESVNRRRPLLLDQSGSGTAAEFFQIAHMLYEVDIARLRAHRPDGGTSKVQTANEQIAISDGG